MLDKLGYTIGLSDLKDYDGKLKTLQYSLNPYQVPAARHTYHHIKDVKSDLYIHAEFFYALPRWLFCKSSAKSNLLVEISQIFRAAMTNPHVKGLVIHVESPFKKEAIAELWNTEDFSQVNWLEFFTKYCSSKMYLEPDELYSKLEGIITVSNNMENFLINLYETSVSELLYDVVNVVPEDSIHEQGAKIFLENTTKPCIQGQPYSVQFISDIAKRNKILLGLAFDEEHAFAAGDTSCFIKPERQGEKFIFPEFLRDLPLLIHYNVPPATVQEGSRKDIHSNTTIFDPNIDSNFHINVLNALDKTDVSFVREVKKETMLKEIQLLNEYYTTHSPKLSDVSDTEGDSWIF